MKSLYLIVILFFSLSAFSSGDFCLFLYKQKKLSHEQLSRRQTIIYNSHSLKVEDLLSVMETKGLLVYKGNHQYKSGTEFIASNEFDWNKTPRDYESTDLIIGFGTNSVWDIAARKKAKKMIIADWSPWPLIGQAFLMAPLFKVATTPEEFVVMLYGLPKSEATGKSLGQVFDQGKSLNLVSPLERREHVENLLIDLAKDSRISELELKFLATFFRERFSEVRISNKYGPFENLKDPLLGQLFYFFNKRYHPQQNGNEASVLSDRTQFHYMREQFAANKIQYALTSIDDFNFYNKVAGDHSAISNYTLSISNIFDSGYNGFSRDDLKNYLSKMTRLFGKPFTVFRTTNNQPPHYYFRYQINSAGEIIDN